ncbi:lipoprotein, NLP/P60 family [Sulfurimonas gotlandica GD1]|uniref:Lipoprotein, NLP/P60 family n=1 Tax=Sulfurimonas gotlandica (strain DSM 19862 / JCM 16533 / GD1) TaxID=929558 RepID=B6BJJ7_SULGG|nr:SH3 domain-containing C40 family peptidase [Sulfurimonas gotlandica]EDZ62694.1 NLP/P60 [Sulfurimonas gotlandica GD1]EHP31242.1 lipoprotein, NLP/P60 family [Sulfurimonas gotlandica GD1]
MRYFFLVLLALIFASCSSKELIVNKEKQEVEKEVKPKQETKKVVEIADLIDIPQNVEFFTNSLNARVETYPIQKKYEQYYFNVWNDIEPREKLEDVKWPFFSYKAGNSYGENFELLKQEFFDEMFQNANFDNYATINAKAITLRHADIRAFPTIKPLLRDPEKAGEGFPFDYLQNSTVYANKPLFVSHYSKDKEWVYAFSSFTSGWIKTSDIVFLKKEHTDSWQNAQQIFLLKEDVPIYSTNGDFLFSSKIGMMLALISEDKENFTALVISSYKNLTPMFERVKISKNIARKEILNLDREALAHIMNEVFKSNYGWGGMYGQRDCSSTLRDMYAPFGIWLPRNSSQQAKVGRIITLENLSDEEKISLIKEEAVPFQTLLYKKGHIVLYVGTVDDEIIVFHNTWGIKTKKNDVEGRVVVGKTVFSTLRLGSNLEDYDKEAEILTNLKSMNILTQ